MSRYILSLGFQSTAFSISPEQSSRSVWIYTQLLICCFSNISPCDLFFFFVMWWLFPLKLAGLQTRTASHWEKLFEIFSPVSFLFWIPPCLMLLTSCWSFLSVFVLILSFDWRLLGSCQNSNSTFASRMDYIQGEALPPGVCDTGSILVIWNMHNIYKGCTSALKALQRSCPTSRRVGGGCSTHSSQEG